MTGAKITIRDNGPYAVEGPIRLLDPEGGDLTPQRTIIYLCRCGASNNKPFCDGTHNRINFESTVRAGS